MGGEPIDHDRRNSATKSDHVGQGKLYSPNYAIKKSDGKDESETEVVQGKLYSPDHAIKIANNNSGESSEEEEKQRDTMMMIGIKNLAAVKDKVLEKLAAAAVPSEKLENTKQFLEGVIRDVAGAAQGMTKDALHRIKTHLADILPSVSPAVTGKIVDDAEKEAVNGEKEDERKSKEEFAGKLPYVSPTSSFFGTLAKPFSRL